MREASEKGKEREKELNVTKNNEHLYKSETYKNIPSSDLTKECFSLQIVLFNHYNTKPTHYDSHLIH